MENSNIVVDRMVTKMNQKIKSEIGHRPDMYISDFRQLDKSSAQVLLAYTSDLGGITPAQIRDFIVAEFKGQLVPKMDTTRTHDSATREALASVVIEVRAPTRPVQDAEHMKIITSNLYLDSDLQESWAVESNDEGTPYLKRMTDVNIAAILEDRKARMATTSNLAKFENVLGAGNPTIGSIVTFYDNGSYRNGTVVGIDNNSCRVVMDGDELNRRSIPYSSITEITAEEDGGTQKKLQDYYTKAFGDSEYARKLVRGMGKKG